MESRNHCVEVVTSSKERPYLTDTYSMDKLLEEDPVTEDGLLQQLALCSYGCAQGYLALKKHV